MMNILKKSADSHFGKNKTKVSLKNKPSEIWGLGGFFVFQCLDFFCVLYYICFMNKGVFA